MRKCDAGQGYSAVRGERKIGRMIIVFRRHEVKKKILKRK